MDHLGSQEVIVDAWGFSNDFAKIAELIKYPGLERFRDLFLADASILDTHEVGLKVEVMLVTHS